MASHLVFRFNGLREIMAKSAKRINDLQPMYFFHSHLTGFLAVLPFILVAQTSH
jgi:hypothetical protein